MTTDAASSGTAISPAMEKLRQLVMIPTISDWDEALIDREPFARLHAAMRELFPLFHEHLELTPVRDDGLLFLWKGRSSERPVVLMAHQDVVPVDPDSAWTHDAFDGVIADGYLWGRGTVDDKGSLVGVMEATERLLAEGFVPAQDIWYFFGSNEEVSGRDAVVATAMLRERGVEPWLVLDEGGAIAEQAFMGVDRPVAVIGVAEKGTTTFQLRVEGRGGHSSQPAPKGPTYRLARAITRIESKPFPAKVPDATLEMLTRLAPHAPKKMQPILSNAPKLAPVLAKALVALGPETASMARTTVAVTTLSGSPAHNVIASVAKAGVNTRIMPGETVASTAAHLRKAIRDDHVHLDLIDAGEPSPISLWKEEPAFELLEQTIAEIFPEAICTPYVVMAATDSRHFTEISERVYRFFPFALSKSQREAIHSFDERIGVQAFENGLVWYERLIRNLG